MVGVAVQEVGEGAATAAVAVVVAEEDLVAAHLALAGEEEEEEARDKTRERAEDTVAIEATKGGAAVVAAAESPACPLVTQYAIGTNQKGAQVGVRAVVAVVAAAAAAAAAKVVGEQRQASLPLAKQRRVLWGRPRPALAVLRGAAALGAVEEATKQRIHQQPPLSGLAAFVAAPPDQLATLLQQERALLTDREGGKEEAAVFVCRPHSSNQTPCPLTSPSLLLTCCRSARGCRRVRGLRRRRP